MMTNYNVRVENITIQEDMHHKDEMLLSYKIEYPQFQSGKFRAAVSRMNQYYKMEALAFQRYCKHKLFKMAVMQYVDSIKNGYPVRAFEALLTYKITYNQDCTVSSYFDRYEYTGGAHGNTTRYSDTWNLQNGRRVLLRQMFPPSIHYRQYIIESINNQISEQIKNGENVYFDDYQKNVANQFNPNSFYLTQKGIVIYFQQYDIGPYSSGILEFTIPYSNGTVMHPQCL